MSASTGSRREFALRLAAELAELFDDRDDFLDFVVAADDRFENFGFRNFACAAFDHHDGVLGAGDQDFEVGFALVDLRPGRVDDVLAVDAAHAASCRRAVERNVGDVESCRSADCGGDVDVGFLIDREDRRDDLRVVEIAFREERADRAVDHTSRKSRFLSRATFALVEAAGDFAGGVEFFGELDGEREEIRACARFLSGARGHEDAGVAVADENGAVGLFGEFAGFDGEGFAAHFTRYFMNLHYNFLERSSARFALDSRFCSVRADWSTRFPSRESYASKQGCNA